MIIRRSEGVLRNRPSRWKDDKVSNCDTWTSGWTGENCEDRRILKSRSFFESLEGLIKYSGSFQIHHIITVGTSVAILNRTCVYVAHL